VGAVRPGTAAPFEIDGHRLCVVNIKEHWYAIGDACSHGNYSLSKGDVWEDDREIECPKHGSLFSLETGEPQSLPATQPVPAYAARVDGDDVIVTLP
jgi:3-phenylpropionate/trans-cinnamate dioxygenase ferredoxin component